MAAERQRAHKAVDKGADAADGCSQAKPSQTKPNSPRVAFLSKHCARTLSNYLLEGEK